MNGMRAHVTDLEHPLPPQGTLNSQVPLLRTGHDEVPRHCQTEYPQGIEWSRAAASASRSVIRSQCRVPSGKALENVQARNEIRVQRAGLRQRVRVGIRAACKRRCGEIRSQAARCSSTECHWEKWRLKRQLVRSANVLANVIDAVPGANCRVVVSEEIVSKPDARSNIRRVVVVECRSIRAARQSRQVQLVHAGGIDEWELSCVR